jgi:hypothetical protein
MSRKRPSVIDNLDLQPDATLAATETNVPQAQETTKATEVHHTSIYLPKVAYRRIREIAAARDVRPHDIIVEGVDMVLAKHGYPSVAELKRGK